MYKLCFYVPETHLEIVKQAVFAQGAGKMGHYEQCAWQCLGQGQFRPQAGSQPYLGKQGELETVAEYKVEMVCEDHLVHSTISALRLAHPYEEPAIEIWQLESIR